jgi:hypothetical protein
MYDDCCRVSSLLCVDHRRGGHANLFQTTSGDSRDRNIRLKRLSQGFSPYLYIAPLGPRPIKVGRLFRLSLPPINFLLCPTSAMPAWPSMLLMCNSEGFVDSPFRYPYALRCVDVYIHCCDRRDLSQSDRHSSNFTAQLARGISSNSLRIKSRACSKPSLTTSVRFTYPILT